MRTSVNYDNELLTMNNELQAENEIRQQFMREAIRLSIENVKSGRGGPFAAVIVKGGKIIASGTNLVSSANDPTAHAEIAAIREACRILNTFQLDGCEIFTSCEPCPCVSVRFIGLERNGFSMETQNKMRRKLTSMIHSFMKNFLKR